MTDTNCPGCRAELDTDQEPDQTAVLTCIHCGYVGIWDTDRWRLLRPEEHAELMQREEFLESIEFGYAFRNWRDRDAAQLCTVIRSRLERLGVPVNAITDLRDEIMAAGYHTHPTEADVRALGLGRHGDVL